ncbi:MAG: tetratricopeptide repeat protein [Candidatus Omnitrophota bacterium]
MIRNRLIVLLLSTVLFFPMACSERKNVHEGKIVVLGMDALDLKILRELIAQNRLPAFKRLMENGAYGVLQSYHPHVSPLIWTTIATGKTPDEHGILDFMGFDNNGAPINIPSSKRRCSALWNILTDHGKSCSVIGWYATWPAETIRGSIISDRFVPPLYVEKQNQPEDILPHLAFPEKLGYALYDYRQEYSQIGCAELSSYIRLNEEECRKILAAPFSFYDRVHFLRLILSRTETYASVLLDLLQNHPADLTLVYFDAADSAAHLFIQERPPRQPEITDEDYARFSNAVDAVYERMDRLLQEVENRLDERDTVIVISDHGFRSGEERLKRSSLTTMGPAVLWHRMEGTILARGPAVQPGGIVNASVFDIAPTLLAMLGIAPSMEMPGKILPELIGGEEKAKAFVRTPDLDGDYRPPELPNAPSSLNAFDREQLEALGYAAAEGKRTKEGKWENVNEYFNLAVYYELREEYEKALGEIDRALSIDPNHRSSLGTKCRLLTRMNLYEKALPEIARVEAILKSKMAAAENELERKKEAESLKTELIRARLDAERIGLSELYHNRGELEYQQGHFEKAVESFSRSLELAPDNMETMYNLGTCCGIAGQYEQSITLLTGLLKLDPQHSKGRQSLAVAYLRTNRAELARPLLESLVLEKPDDANILYLMGEAFRTEQNFEKAREWYEKALRIDPNLKKAKQKLEALTEEK